QARRVRARVACRRPAVTGGDGLQRHRPLGRTRGEPLRVDPRLRRRHGIGRGGVPRVVRAHGALAESGAARRRAPRRLAGGASLDSTEREREPERCDREAVRHLALLDQRANVLPGAPGDATGLRAVYHADVLRARRDEVLEALLHQAVRRVAEAALLEPERSPPGLLDRLALGRLLERLAGVDAAGRDLPAPGAGDEP